VADPRKVDEMTRVSVPWVGVGVEVGGRLKPASLEWPPTSLLPQMPAEDIGGHYHGSEDESHVLSSANHRG
jgi:hypothetical protein